MRAVWIAIGVLVTAWSIDKPAFAQTHRDQVSDARIAVSEVLYASSVTSETALRWADARLSEQRATISALQSQIRSTQSRDIALLAQLAAAQESYVDQLAALDRVYSAELAVLRRAAEDIASTTEGVAALNAFNAGDELRGLTALDELRDARRRGRNARSDIESAAEGRRIAVLALEARARGRVTTASVISRYEEVTRLDPGFAWDWIELGRLYADESDLAEARAAAERARNAALNNYERALALHDLGVMLQSEGRYAEAARVFGENLALIRIQAEQSPQSAGLQRDLSIAMGRVGATLASQGDHRGALRYMEESLALTQRIAEQHPLEVWALLDQGWAAQELADFRMTMGEIPAAHAMLGESLRVRRLALSLQPGLIAARRDVGTSLERLGVAFLTQNNLASARASYEESLRIREALSQEDPGFLDLRRDVAISHLGLAETYLLQGDVLRALATAQAGEVILRQMIDTAPEAARPLRDHAVNLALLARIPNSGVTWADVLSAFDDLSRRGHLEPRDQRLLAMVRQLAAANTPPGRAPSSDRK